MMHTVKPDEAAVLCAIETASSHNLVSDNESPMVNGTGTAMRGSKQALSLRSI